MAAKDYYLILGVSRSESPAGIRARYRDLVRRLHPDLVGPQSTSAFQEIREAYETLADPQARRRHNAELERPEARRSIERNESIATPTVRVPKAERRRALTIEVILTPEEAGRGVAVPIRVPTLRRCNDCAGTGREWLFPCVSCDTQGVIATERTVRVTIAPGVPPGTVIEGPLVGLDMHDVYLRLHVRIQ